MGGAKPGEGGANETVAEMKCFTVAPSKKLDFMLFTTDHAIYSDVDASYKKKIHRGMRSKLIKMRSKNRELEITIPS